MKPELLVIGGGGHAAACIDVIEQENIFTIVGIVEKDPGLTALLGYPVIGSDADLPALKKKFDHVFIALGQIGSASHRIKLFENVKALGFRLPVIGSPRAYVSKHAKVEEGTIIMHDALVNARATIGRGCIINSKALIEHDAVIKDFCHISTAAVVNGACVVENGSFIGSNAVTKENVKTKGDDFIKAGSVFKGYGQ